MRKVTLTVRPANITKSGKPDRRFKAQRDKRKANWVKFEAANTNANAKAKAKREANWAERDKAKFAAELEAGRVKANRDKLLAFDKVEWNVAKGGKSHVTFFDEIPQADPEVAKAMAQMVSERKLGEHRLEPKPRLPVYTLDNIITVARSLEPSAGTEYARGVTELIGRLVLDMSGTGEGTSENAKIFALLVCTN